MMCVHARVILEKRIPLVRRWPEAHDSFLALPRKHRGCGVHVALDREEGWL